MLNKINLSISNSNEILYIAKALDNPQRLDILKLLEKRSLNITEIARIIHIPVSTCAQHIDILSRAGLIITDTKYSTQGQSKLCSRNCDQISILIHEISEPQNTAHFSTSISIGDYIDYDVVLPCGLASSAGMIGIENNTDSFFSPLRHKAELIWFSSGYLEYRISNKNIPKAFKLIEISFEACSEAPYYRMDWKSDITLWLNGTEIGTWTSPSDFGGRRGQQNPAWWPNSLTQFGTLLVWQIKDNTLTINGEPHFEKDLSKLDLTSSPYISLRIGVKKDAANKGGLNLFGSSFGDYPQNILFRVYT